MGFAVAVVLSEIVGTLETKSLNMLMKHFPWGFQENQSFLYTVLSTYQ